MSNKRRKQILKNQTSTEEVTQKKPSQIDESRTQIEQTEAKEENLQTGVMSEFSLKDERENTSSNIHSNTLKVEGIFPDDHFKQQSEELEYQGQLQKQEKQQKEKSENEQLTQILEGQQDKEIVNDEQCTDKQEKLTIKNEGEEENKNSVVHVEFQQNNEVQSDEILLKVQMNNEVVTQMKEVPEQFNEQIKEQNQKDHEVVLIEQVEEEKHQEIIQSSEQRINQEKFIETLEVHNEFLAHNQDAPIKVEIHDQEVHHEEQLQKVDNKLQLEESNQGEELKSQESYLESVKIVHNQEETNIDVIIQIQGPQPAEKVEDNEDKEVNDNMELHQLQQVNDEIAGINDINEKYQDQEQQLNAQELDQEKAQELNNEVKETNNQLQQVQELYKEVKETNNQVQQVQQVQLVNNEDQLEYNVNEQREDINKSSDPAQYQIVSIESSQSPQRSRRVSPQLSEVVQSPQRSERVSPQRSRRVSPQLSEVVQSPQRSERVSITSEMVSTTEIFDTQKPQQNIQQEQQLLEFEEYKMKKQDNQHIDEQSQKSAQQISETILINSLHSEQPEMIGEQTNVVQPVPQEEKKVIEDPMMNMKAVLIKRFTDTYREVDMLKNQGNEFVRQKDHSKATTPYVDALRLCHPIYLNECPGELIDSFKTQNINILNNLGLCYLSLNELDKCITALTQVLQIEVTNLKAIYRMALAYEKKQDLEEAWNYIKKASSLAAKDKKGDNQIFEKYYEIKKAYQQQISDNKEKQGQFYQKMFNQEENKSSTSAVQQEPNKSKNEDQKQEETSKLYYIPLYYIILESPVESIVQEASGGKQENKRASIISSEFVLNLTASTVVASAMTSLVLNKKINSTNGLSVFGLLSVLIFGAFRSKRIWQKFSFAAATTGSMTLLLFMKSKQKL